MLSNEKYLIPLLHSAFELNQQKIALKGSDGECVTRGDLFRFCFEKNPFTVVNHKNGTYLIAVYGDKCPSAFSLVYAIIAAGQAYLPIDYYSPPERVCFILENSGCQSLLVEKKSSSKITACFESQNVNFQIKNFNESYNLVIFEKYRSYNNSVAYVLYTSGSTGSPKGVIHTHKSALAFINWFNEGLDIKHNTFFISIAPLSFDVSIPDIYCCLLSGGMLYIPNYSETANMRFISEKIEHEKINVIYSTPTFFKTLLTYGKCQNKNYKTVSHIVYAGEQLYYKLVNEVKEIFKNAVHFNLYGPTETNVCTFFKIKLDRGNGEEVVPIGELCNYAKKHEKLSEGGYELLIDSESTMLGYVDGTEKMATIDGVLFYPTGDIVYNNIEGQIVFKYRNDKMVKRNGFRIELNEIEACLSKNEAISDFVVKTGDDSENKIIKVYYSSEKEITEFALKNYCLSKLPSYMIPDEFIRLDFIPKNANFKLDINKL